MYEGRTGRGLDFGVKPPKIRAHSFGSRYKSAGGLSISAPMELLSVCMSVKDRVKYFSLGMVQAFGVNFIVRMVFAKCNSCMFVACFRGLFHSMRLCY